MEITSTTLQIPIWLIEYSEIILTCIITILGLAIILYCIHKIVFRIACIKFTLKHMTGSSNPEYWDYDDDEEDI